MKTSSLQSKRRGHYYDSIRETNGQVYPLSIPRIGILITTFISLKVWVQGPVHYVLYTYWLLKSFTVADLAIISATICCTPRFTCSILPRPINGKREISLTSWQHCNKTVQKRRLQLYIHWMKLDTCIEKCIMHYSTP